MTEFAFALINDPWWVDNAETASAWGKVYHWFNLSGAGTGERGGACFTLVATTLHSQTV